MPEDDLWPTEALAGDNMKPARPEDLPQATHAGVSELFGVKTRVYRLDDGRAVIDADDFHKLLEAMGLPPQTPKE